MFFLVMLPFTIIGAGMVAYGAVYLLSMFFIDCDLELAILEKIGKSPSVLKDKICLVTGASSGIGEYIAKALAKRGVKLVLAARRQNELERVKQECIALSKGQLSDSDILVLVLDITDLPSHQPAFDKVLSHFGKLDILVNNAGRSQRALFDYIDIQVDRAMFELNVFGVVNFSRIALKHFNERSSGHLAVVSSMAGVFGVPYSATYTATKHAIHGYFNALRNEKMGKNISVTLLCPGPTFTNFLAESFTETPGQKYGIDAKPTDKRMTSERCGELCAIALANKTRESWMGLFPMMLFGYSAVFFPILSHWAIKTVGTQRIFKIRDSGDIKLNEGKDN